MIAPELVPPGMHAGMDGWAILHGYRGSIAHGMHIPSDDPDSIDDVDTMAFCVPPLDHYIGLLPFGSRGTVEVKQGQWDVVIYEARKAVGLLAKGNPNALTMLWLPEDMILTEREGGRLLRQHRDVFVSDAIPAAFLGYAHDQFSKMERGAFKGYMGDRRKALVERHGYDTKNAAHLMRLLRMGIEFMQTGALNVYRQDAEELLEIKRGAWSLERVKREAEGLFGEAKSLRAQSALPPVDRGKVSNLCAAVVEATLRRRGELL